MARSGAPAKKTDSTPTPGPRISRKTIIGIIVGVVVVAAIVAIEASTQGFEEGGLPQFQDVSVTGASLPAYAGSGQGDAAVGAAAPVLSGSDWDGNQLTIEPNGDPSLVMVITHWCAHCQADVPIVQDIVDSDVVPDGLNLYAVVSGTNEQAANYPPTKWLIDEGWTVPSMLDDQSNTAGSALGLTAYPYWILLDGEGRVTARLTGELPRETILDLMNQASGAGTGSTIEEGESSSAEG